jgi:uncharacterized protein
MPGDAAVGAGEAAASANDLTVGIIRFARLLRAAGMSCGLEESRSAVAAVDYVGIRDLQRFRDALAATLVKRGEEIELFDQAFELYWRRPDQRLQPLEEVLRQIRSRLAPPRDRRRVSQRLVWAFFGQSGADERHEEEPPAPVGGAASSREELLQRDFAQLSPDEFSMLARMLPRLIRHWPKRRTRRFAVDAALGRPDWRRTMRAMTRLRNVPVRTRPRLQAVPLILLIDVSGSMTAYLRRALLFAHALCQTRKPVEVFVFATRLTRITRQLRSKDFDIGVAVASRTAIDWEGGTSLAACLQQFVEQWLKAVASRPSDFVMFTDGLEGDDDDPPQVQARLESLLARIRARVRSFAWVNPMFQIPGYQAAALGPSVLDRHADRRLSGHNLADLMALFEPTAGNTEISGNPYLSGLAWFNFVQSRQMPPAIRMLDLAQSLSPDEDLWRFLRQQTMFYKTGDLEALASLTDPDQILALAERARVAGPTADYEYSDSISNAVRRLLNQMRSREAQLLLDAVPVTAIRYPLLDGTHFSIAWASHRLQTRAVG